MTFFSLRRIIAFVGRARCVRLTIAELCKGSTNDSDSFSPGSNPGSAASTCRHGQAVKTSPSHGENRGSSPRGGAKALKTLSFQGFSLFWIALQAQGGCATRPIPLQDVDEVNRLTDRCKAYKARRRICKRGSLPGRK